MLPKQAQHPGPLWGKTYWYVIQGHFCSSAARVQQRNSRNCKRGLMEVETVLLWFSTPFPPPNLLCYLWALCLLMHLLQCNVEGRLDTPLSEPKIFWCSPTKSCPAHWHECLYQFSAPNNKECVLTHCVLCHVCPWTCLRVGSNVNLPSCWGEGESSLQSLLECLPLFSSEVPMSWGVYMRPLVLFFFKIYCC